MVKKCTKCGEEKALTEFGKHQTGKYGVRGKCKICEREYNRELYRRPENRERKNAYIRIFMREYRQRPEVKKKRREYLQRPEVQSRNKAFFESPARREYGREYMRRKREMGIESTTQHIEITEKYATRSGKWSDAEVQFLMSSELPLVDIALELGRTYRSVSLKRLKVREKLEGQQ